VKKRAKEIYLAEKKKGKGYKPRAITIYEKEFNMTRMAAAVLACEVEVEKD
jgi:hypothetical protein